MEDKLHARPVKRIALIYVCFFVVHCCLLVAGTFERSADGWIHLFFADHWYQSWFNHWEPRWYGGFSMFAYPPLMHQLMAVLRLLLEPVASGVTAMLLATVVLCAGLYRYLRVWGCQSHLGIWLVLVSSPLCISVHTFAQLPNLMAFGLLLHGLTYTHAYLQSDKDNQVNAVLGLLWLLSAFLCSLYASVFGALLLGVPILIEQRNTTNFWRRLSIFSTGLFLLSACALSPAIYFRYALAAAEAVPVFHSSQGDVLKWSKAFNWYMFYGQYGILLFVWPFLLRKETRKFWCSFGCSAVLMFLLSTGRSLGVAPILLRDLFYQINLDRFAQWTSLILLMLLGFAYLRSQRKSLWAGVFVLHICAGAYSASTTWRKPLPSMLDLSSAVDYLNQHQNYRYLTLGLHRANQAKLSTLVHAPNLDGNFPFGRNFKPLNGSGIASLDMSRHYGRRGRGVLIRILNDAEDYHLKYIVLKDRRYLPVLWDRGWRIKKEWGKIRLLAKANIPPLTSESYNRLENPVIFQWIWSFFPLSIFVLAIVTGVKKARFYNTRL